MKRWISIPLMALLALSITGFNGCGGNSLPKPNTAKQAGIEGLVGYGLAAHEVARYTAYPECTSPVTVLPCSKASIVATLRNADNKAYAAAVAFDNAVNDPQFDKSALDKLAVSSREANKLIQDMTPAEKDSK